MRPGVTRFATTFLTLQSLLEKKQKLRFMFVSDEWESCKDSNYVKGQSAYYTFVSPAFWNGLSRVVKVLEPLVKVLRMVEGEKKPSMGFVYGELVEAKRCIKAATNNLEKYYQPIFEIIDEKIKGRLDSPLHLAAYVLNPFYFYNEPTVQLDEKLMMGFYNCVETIYHGEIENQDEVVNQFKIYEEKLEYFGKPYALRGREETPTNLNQVFLFSLNQITSKFVKLSLMFQFDYVGNWWSLYGFNVPHLLKLAMKVLSLTSSSSGCQRNWRTFKEVCVFYVSTLSFVTEFGKC